MKMKLLFIIGKQNFKIMWEKIKIDLKELWSIIKWAALFGLASDLVFMIFEREWYARETPFPFFCTLSYPIFTVVGLIVWGIIIWGIFPLIFKFIDLIPNWLINITPKWLRRLLNSGTFWIWAWSIGSIILLSLLK